MALKDHINLQTEVKPFRLVKYFAVASFVVLIVISFPFALFISNGAKKIMLEDFFEDYRNAVGENLNNVFSENFIRDVLVIYGELNLGSEEQQKLLDERMKFAIRNTNIELLKIYAIENGQVVYSTDPKYFKEKIVESQEYLKAVQGESASFMMPEGAGALGFWKGWIGGTKKVTAYIPITLFLESTGEEYVAGVFEVVLDMTKRYNSVVRLQYFIFGVSLFIMVLIFFALLFIVHNAEEIIRNRTSEQKKLEEQLHLAERLAALGQMVTGVSHEIKNPLGIIQSTAELLSEMNQTDEKQKKLSLVIKEESIRLNNTVTEFLDFARPYELNLQECRLDEIISKNITFLSQELEKKGITVRDNFEGRELTIHADPERLYRVFLNLIINSIQSMDGPGEINIKVDEDRDTYIIKIEDTGAGINEENLKKIFNPFFTTKQKGSGLGLPIVRNIIESHEGTIAIENIEAGGARVIIKLLKIR